MQAKDIMTHAVKTVAPTTQLIDVVSMMCLSRYRGIVAAVGDELVGMLRLGDVHKANISRTSALIRATVLNPRV